MVNQCLTLYFYCPSLGSVFHNTANKSHQLQHITTVYICIHPLYLQWHKITSCFETNFKSEHATVVIGLCT